MRTFVQKQKPAQQAKSASSAISSRAFSGPSREVSSLLHLQRTVGNQAIQRLLRANVKDREDSSPTSASFRFSHDFSRIPVHANAYTNIQSKLKVNTPGDVYEWEADHVADRVLRMPESAIQRACTCGGECPECQSEQHQHHKKRVQTKPVALKSGDSDIKSSQVQEKAGFLGRGGQPLPDSVRSYFEPRFGHDFSQIRIRADGQARRLCRFINAQAFTYGNNIYFGEGYFSPDTRSGKRLLAHELTHTLQQQDSTASMGHQVVQRAVECDESGVCMSVPDPENVASLLPPGDCTPAEHRALQNEVNRACKGRSRRCLGTDDCATIWDKIEANAECIRARSVINARCFRGGDAGHNEALVAAVGALNNCWAVFNRNCQTWTPPILVPVPEPVPERRPVVDKDFMDRMAEVTGLTGAALVTYLIISEGSRILFPPRNLVPVP